VRPPTSPEGDPGSPDASAVPAPDGVGSPDGPAPTDTARPPTDTTPRFSAPRDRRVEAHVRALRARPDDTDLPCWPRDLIDPAPASRALEKGARPCLVVFYDETARASRLAAADLWPVVLELEARVDVVLVDLTPGTRRKPTDEERKLTRKYYLGYVPTTVVLTSERAPRLLKSERVDAALVRAAILESK